MFKSKLKIPPNDGDQRKGSLKAPVVLVQYGDFQCSPCRKLMPVLEDLKNHFGEDLCFIYRHFPLRSIHPAAEFAAIAAEAAGVQGQFWPMHHLLFQNQNELDAMTIKALGSSLNLSRKQFLEDLNLPILREKVQNDFNGGVRSGVNGTPCLYLNGARYTGLFSYKMLSQEIEELRKPKGLFSFFS